jgi:hypothetical protein
VLPSTLQCLELLLRVQVTGKGLRYSGVGDCLLKTLQAEGLRGLYKGWLPNWMRIG